MKNVDTVERCSFSEAWIGQCKAEVYRNGMCFKHSQSVCCGCGKSATHTCEETMSLVCGADLCSECEHTICDNGCNSGGKLPEGVEWHCKKEQQVYKPWYMRDNEQDIYLNPCKKY